MNLDQLAYQKGIKIADSLKDKEKEIRNLAHIMRQHGPYAFVLYLESRFKDNEKDKVSSALLELIQSNISTGNVTTSFKEAIEEASEDIYQLNLIKSLFDQCLSYAVYHLKTFEKTDDKGSQA